MEPALQSVEPGSRREGCIRPRESSHGSTRPTRSTPRWGAESDKGFTEEALHNVVHRYGDIAQGCSTYQKHFWNDDRFLGRGIHGFQLVHHDGRWWIVSIIWDEENGAGPIPEPYGGRE